MSKEDHLHESGAQVETVIGHRGTHTPGPWRWEINLKSKQIQLCGGRPKFDHTVMDFVRWGMTGAAPRFLFKPGGHLLLDHCSKVATIVPGREHHASWFQTLNHPDANLIAAAPDLLAACRSLLERYLVIGCGEGVEALAARAAIAKAEGRI